MNLSDRIDRALARNKLPKVHTPIKESVETTGIYKSLNEVKFGNHKVDEDGVGCIVVETINGDIKLPMKVGNFTIQDIQKRNDGLYTVQFIEE